MEVGGLNKTAVFKINSPATAGAGTTDSYSTLLTTKCSLRRLGGGRGLSFGELLQSDSFELITRYQSSLASNLRLDMKVIIDSRTFTVASYELVDERKRYYRMTVNESRN